MSDVAGQKRSTPSEPMNFRSKRSKEEVSADIVKRLNDAQQSLLLSGEFADLTIVSQGREFKVHKAILVPRCKFFRAMCSGPFVESSTPRIQMNDDDPDAVKILLEFLYVKFTALALEKLAETCKKPRWQLLTSIYRIADKYDLPLLLELVRDAYDSCAKRWEAKELLCALQSVGDPGDSNALQQYREFLMDEVTKCVCVHGTDNESESMLKENPDLPIALINLMSKRFREAGHDGTDFQALYNQQKALTVELISQRDAARKRIRGSNTR